MSVEMNVSIEGLSELGTKLERLDYSIAGRVHEALTDEGQEIKTTAQALCPVRTGYLRSTIFAQIEDWSLKVGASARYAAYVEFGTQFVKARRFLSRALELRIQPLIGAVGTAVDWAVEEASR